MKLTFIFDFLSPFSYLAFKILKETELTNVDILYKPVIMQRVITAFSPLGPAQIPAKRDYLFDECIRFASNNNINFNVPVALPFNSLDMLKLALKEVSKDKQLQIISKIFSSVWENSLELIVKDDFVKIFSDISNFDSIWERSQERAARKILKDNTKMTISGNIFGVPTFLLKDDNRQRIFWGKDSFEDLIKAIEGNDPCLKKVNIDKINRYRALFNN